jgi:hypothetical protein
MLEQVIHDLEQHGQIARIKKLVFAAQHGRWSNDAQSMSREELQQNIQLLGDRYASIAELRQALDAIVQRLNHSEVYQVIATALSNELEPIYSNSLFPPPPATATPPEVERIIHLQILGSAQNQQIVCKILANDQPQAQVSIDLPSYLVREYHEWQSQYRQLEPEQSAPPKIRQCQTATNELLQQFHDWFKGADFQPLRKEIQQHVPMIAPIQVLITSSEVAMLKLPWNLCLQQILPAHLQTEVVVRLAEPLATATPQVSICSIISSGAKINIDKSRSQLQSLPATHCHFLVGAKPAAVLRAIAKPGNVLLISSQLSGYAHPDRILVNAQDSITSAELRTALHSAVRQGLQLLVLNVGDALELAADLTEVNIPHMVVMRELIPDRVANELMKLILKDMARGQSLSLALRDSRSKLQRVERVFPAVSWLPLLFQPRAVADLQWLDFATAQLPTTVAAPATALPAPVVPAASLTPDYRCLALVQQITGYHSAVQDLAFSLDRQYLISSHQDHITRVWQLANGELLQRSSDHDLFVQSLALIHDQRNQRQQALSDQEGMRQALAHHRHINHQAVAVTADGQQVVSAGTDQTIRIWAVATGQLHQTLIGHERAINCLVITPDDRSIISGSADRQIKVWRMADGCLLNNLSGHQESIMAIAISPDGQFLATGGGSEIRLWRVG